MIRGRVLVIDGEDTGEELAESLRSKGYTVDVRKEARTGFSRAVEVMPDCIICNPELPDIDGAWVARHVRTESGPLSRVPFLFVGAVIDKEVRTQALGVGVDVFLARPPAHDEEIVAQVDALIAMARRIGGSREDGSSPSSTSFSAAIRGDLSAFPLASMLMMFEMERRTGIVQVVAESGRRGSLTITSGLFASTQLDGVDKPALDVLRQVLSWRSGRFSFQTREGSSLPEPKGSVGALVLEAMRLEDEEKGPGGFSVPVNSGLGSMPPSSIPVTHSSTPPPMSSIPPISVAHMPPESSAAITAARFAAIRESTAALSNRDSSSAIELDSNDLVEAVESRRNPSFPRPSPSPPSSEPSRVPSPPEVPRVSSRPRPKKIAP